MRAWYAFYPKDFMIDTPHLNLEERGFYRELIDHYYMSGGPLPHNPKLIATQLRLNLKITRRLLPVVEEFFDIRNGLMHHKRIDAELQKAKQIQERRAKAGRKGGQANAKQMLNDENKQMLKQATTTTTTTTTDKDINTSSANALHVDTPEKGNGKADPVPYQKIVSLYHDILGEDLPHVASLSTARRSQIRSRWNNGLPSLDSWRKYFELVSESDFLMGRCPPGRGKDKPFVANIDWLIKEGNVLKVVEGNYHG